MLTLSRSSVGMPHVTTESDTYEGYFIPKGATLVASMWWFAHDPKYYHDAYNFKPERFDAPYSEQKPWDIMFGSGRRVCPGRFFGDASVWLAVAQMLAVFNIRKSFDQEGREIEPQKQLEGGLFNSLAPFAVNVTPRSEKAAELIRRLEVSCKLQEDHAKLLNKEKMPAELRTSLSS